MHIRRIQKSRNNKKKENYLRNCEIYSISLQFSLIRQDIESCGFGTLKLLNEFHLN